MAKQILSSMILFLIGITLLLPALRATEGKAPYSDQVAVLMYHHVHDTDESSSTISSKLFEDQLTYLRDRGYKFISLEQFEQYMQGASVPDNAVFVTFDDGYESFYTHAYPILTKHGIPATNFVITDKHANPQEYQPPFMSADQIMTMTSAHPRMISAQCHTNGMHNDPVTPYMTNRIIVDGVRETEEQYRERIVADTQACIRTMTPLGPEKVNAMAYPYGVFDKLSAELVREAGIQYAFTIVPEMAKRSASPLQIPRINAGNPNITPEVLVEKIRRRIQLNVP
ncbi:polysaccharide deacetylase family protein [Paenibacillus mesophilus]|uniref:polysaccharide deacetylase family protein n=1 Tax=Paenibacillus mesophilus TaxID=2582849 RepID=UPI00110EE4BF|nr:polysaccharide deacetylase family protein [Paenibacillus mesophilus]TMV48293.1 polysaccharide deacetylase family protein [Paenibacillus mesophilus]